MKNQKLSAVFFGFSVVSFCLWAGSLVIPGSSAFAALGGTSDSIEADRQALPAAAKKSFQTVNDGNYNVTTLDSNGVTVREYSSNQGVVFGIAWEGRARPDFSKILGAHFDEYQAAAQTQNGASSVSSNVSVLNHRSSHSVRTENLVLESSGQMRNLHGRAYLPNEVPSGVSLDEIK